MGGAGLQGVENPAWYAFRSTLPFGILRFKEDLRSELVFSLDAGYSRDRSPLPVPLRRY